MSPTDKSRRLGSMLRQVAPTENVTEVPRGRAGRIAGGLEGLDVMELAGPERGGAALATEDDVESALRKVSEGRDAELTPPERFGLEAIVMPQNRPVMFIHDGTYDPCEEPWTHLNANDVRARITPLLASVGRVELPNSPNIPYGGTAFVVGPDLLMTNRHVARIFTEGVGLPRRLAYRAGDAGVNLRRENRLPASRACRPTRARSPFRSARRRTSSAATWRRSVTPPATTATTWTCRTASSRANTTSNASNPGRSGRAPRSRASSRSSAP
jgi:endonuclease G, mitochondrial